MTMACTIIGVERKTSIYTARMAARGAQQRPAQRAVLAAAGNRAHDADAQTDQEAGERAGEGDQQRGSRAAQEHGTVGLHEDTRPTQRNRIAAFGMASTPVSLRQRGAGEVAGRRAGGPPCTSAQGTEPPENPAAEGNILYVQRSWAAEGRPRLGGLVEFGAFGVGRLYGVNGAPVREIRGPGELSAWGNRKAVMPRSRAG